MRAPDFWKRSGLLSTCLVPASWPPRILAQLRRATVTPQTLPIPVFCIGNVTVADRVRPRFNGHPEAASRAWRERAFQRGYGGSLKGSVKVNVDVHSASEVGDEALLLARQAPCWISANRSAGALAAVESGADAIIMDDGFQNPILEKTLRL